MGVSQKTIHMELINAFPTHLRSKNIWW